MADVQAPNTPRRGWARMARVLVSTVVVFYLLYGLALMGFQERLIFPRDVPGRRDPSRVPPGVEQIVVTGEDGSKVPAWLRVPDHEAGKGLPAVVFFHGNAEVIDDVAHSAEVMIYPAMGVAVLVVEFRGYGRAEGDPSEASIVADSVKMYDVLAARPDIDPRRIAFYGRSLGGGVACAVARQRPPRAMILQSTFTSVRAMAAKMLVPGFLVRHPFRNDEAVAALDLPILFMHGAKDSIIPRSHSDQLLAVAKRGWMVCQDCDHNDFPTDADGYRAEIEKFLRENGIVD